MSTRYIYLLSLSLSGLLPLGCSSSSPKSTPCPTGSSCEGSGTTGTAETSDTTPSSGGSTGDPAGSESSQSGGVENGPLNEVFDQAAAEGFSGVAMVRHQGEVLLHEAAGFASRADDILIEPDTPIVIGSITKQFTAAAILELREQGELSLEETLLDFFPDVPADKADITVHQLLTHTAGVPGYLGPDEEEIDKEAYLQRFFDQELDAAPGTVHSYSNVGYSILAAIIELRSGTSYPEFLETELFAPSGMQYTGLLLPTWDGPQPAEGYLEDQVDDPLSRPNDGTGYYWNLRGNGGLISTAADLMLWDDSLQAGTVLEPESVELLTTPHVSEGTGSGTFYAYGWVIEESGAGKLVWHDGGNGFFYGHLYRYVDADLQVVVLANETNDAADTLTRALAEAVIPELVPDTWEVLFFQEGEVESDSNPVVYEVEVGDSETHLSAVGLELSEGSASWRILDPDGQIVESGDATPDDPVDTSAIVEGQPGTWTLRIEMEEATGFVFAAWAKLLGQGVPCPDGSDCVELSPSLLE